MLVLKALQLARTRERKIARVLTATNFKSPANSVARCFRICDKALVAHYQPQRLSTTSRRAGGR